MILHGVGLPPDTDGRSPPIVDLVTFLHSSASVRCSLRHYVKAMRRPSKRSKKIRRYSAQSALSYNSRKSSRRWPAGSPVARIFHHLQASSRHLDRLRGLFTRVNLDCRKMKRKEDSKNCNPVAAQ